MAARSRARSRSRPTSVSASRPCAPAWRSGAEELERTQAQFIAAQRLEAVARLAGGVAHDFNNILSLIMSYADVSLETLGEADPLRGDLQPLQDAARRAATLTRRLPAAALSRRVREVLDAPARIARAD